MLARARRSVVVIDAGAPRNAPAANVHGLLARDGMPPSELLERGDCREETLAAEDLPHVRLWVGNALRGLMPARWPG